MHIHPRLVMRTRPAPVPTPSLTESQELIAHGFESHDRAVKTGTALPCLDNVPAFKGEFVESARVEHPGRAADSGRSSPGRPPIPPALYLPSTGASNTRGAEIELRQMRDGRVALLAYTALDRLARCLGPNQPWVLYLTENLDQLEAVQSYDVIYLDTPVPRNLWHQTKDDEDGAVR